MPPPRSAPLLRGYIHLAAASLAPIALVYLLLNASTGTEYVGSAIFGTGAILLFAASSAYHLAPLGPTARAFARRLDHSAIFVATASFYTPFCIGVLPPPWGIPLLAVVWTLAALGVALRCFWLCAPRGLVMATYLGVGWLAAVATTQLARELPTDGFVLLVGAGVAYSTGALCFAARWPNPAPRFIGHHELFHAMVVAATACLFVVVATNA